MTTTTITQQPSRATTSRPAPAPAALVVGWIVSIDVEGRATVDYPANPEPPLLASTLVAVPREALENVRVTLGFLDGDRCRPVITGILQDSIVEEERALRECAVLDRPGEISAAVIDDRRVVLRADQEICLECGKSSITLRKDGRVVIRGTKLWSRASEVNRIHGANVRIN